MAPPFEEENFYGLRPGWKTIMLSSLSLVVQQAYPQEILLSRFCCGRGSVAASANNFAILLFGAIAGFTWIMPQNLLYRTRSKGLPFSLTHVRIGNFSGFFPVKHFGMQHSQLARNFTKPQSSFFTESF